MKDMLKDGVGIRLIQTHTTDAW